MKRKERKTNDKKNYKRNTETRTTDSFRPLPPLHPPTPSPGWEIVMAHVTQIEERI